MLKCEILALPGPPKQSGVSSREKKRRVALIRGWKTADLPANYCVEVVVVVEVAGGNCVVVSWCVVVVEVVCGSDEQAPSPRAAEIPMARRKNLVFMFGV